MVKAKQANGVKLNEEAVEMHSKSHQEEYERHGRVKTGAQRLDRRSAQGVSGLPKKSGQGGKFTWGGPLDERSADDSPVALDEKDPNYVDEDIAVGQVSSANFRKRLII